MFAVSFAGELSGDGKRQHLFRCVFINSWFCAFTFYLYFTSKSNKASPFTRPLCVSVSLNVLKFLHSTHRISDFFPRPMFLFFNKFVLFNNHQRAYTNRWEREKTELIFSHFEMVLAFGIYAGLDLVGVRGKLQKNFQTSVCRHFSIDEEKKESFSVSAACCETPKYIHSINQNQYFMAFYYIFLNRFSS